MKNQTTSSASYLKRNTCNNTKLASSDWIAYLLRMGQTARMQELRFANSKDQAAFCSALNGSPNDN